MDFWTADDGIKIAFELAGPEHGAPVILQHGFGSSSRGEWTSTGIAAKLQAAGRRTVVMNARGHGASDKPHDPAFYGEVRMSKDLQGVATYLGLASYDLAGYSMGAIISLITASEDRRVRRLAIGGVGDGILARGGVDTRVAPNLLIAEALLCDDPADAPAVVASFRHFVDVNGGDRLALAAQAKSAHQGSIPSDQISAETLVFAGDKDPLAANPQRLADAINGADLLIGKGDHLSVFGDADLRNGIIAFLLG